MRNYKRPVSSSATVGKANAKSSEFKELAEGFAHGLSGVALPQNKLPRKLEGFKHD